MATINEILKENNLTQANAVITFEPETTFKEFKMCLKMSFDNKTEAIEVIKEKIIEQNTILIIGDSEQFSMFDFMEILDDNSDLDDFENEETDEKTKKNIGLYCIGNFKKIIVYMFY